MVRDFKKILVKHLSPSGVLEKEIVIQLLIDFIDEKIMDCTLGVNLEIVNFLGGAVELKNENKKSDQQRGGNNPKSNSPNNASGPSGNINSNGHSGFSGSNGAKQKYGQHNQQYDGCMMASTASARMAVEVANTTLRWWVEQPEQQNQSSQVCHLQQ